MLYTRKLLELIDEFSKVAGYKINTQQSVTFLYTNNERSERDIKETVPFTITSKRIKHLGINLPQGAKDLSSKNYKIPVLQNYNDTNGKVYNALPIQEHGIYLHLFVSSLISFISVL